MQLKPTIKSKFSKIVLNLLVIFTFIVVLSLSGMKYSPNVDTVKKNSTNTDTIVVKVKNLANEGKTQNEVVVVANINPFTGEDTGKPIPDDIMSSFDKIGLYKNYYFVDDKIDMAQVDMFMKVFNKTKIITINSKLTPLTIGAIYLFSIADRGIAAEMVRRLNKFPSITTELKIGVKIKIPYMEIEKII